MLYPAELLARTASILTDFIGGVKVEHGEILNGGKYHLAIPKRQIFWYDKKKNGRNLYG